MKTLNDELFLRASLFLHMLIPVSGTFSTKLTHISTIINLLFSFKHFNNACVVFSPLSQPQIQTGEVLECNVY